MLGKEERIESAELCYEELTALKDHSCGIEHLYHFCHDGLEQAVEGGVSGAHHQWNIQGIEFAPALSHIFQGSRAGKERVAGICHAILMEADSHDPAAIELN